MRVALWGQRVLEWALACMDSVERPRPMLLVFDGIFSAGQKERLRGRSRCTGRIRSTCTNTTKASLHGKTTLFSLHVCAGEGKRELVGGGRRVPDSPEEREGEEMEAAARRLGLWQLSQVAVTGRCHRGKARPSLSGASIADRINLAITLSPSRPGLGLERGPGIHARGGGKGQRRRRARPESN
jgi:hypothetical protein